MRPPRASPVRVRVEWPCARGGLCARARGRARVCAREWAGAREVLEPKLQSITASLAIFHHRSGGGSK